jgi:hypothetical protein
MGECPIKEWRDIHCFPSHVAANVPQDLRAVANFRQVYHVARNDSVALGDLSGMPSAADLRGTISTL